MYPSAPRPYNPEFFLDRFESRVSLEFRRRNIHQDDPHRQVYLDVLRTILEAGATPSSDGQGFTPSTLELNRPSPTISEARTDQIGVGQTISERHSPAQVFGVLQSNPLSPLTQSQAPASPPVFDGNLLSLHSTASPRSLELNPTPGSEGFPNFNSLRPSYDLVERPIVPGSHQQSLSSNSPATVSTVTQPTNGLDDLGLDESGASMEDFFNFDPGNGLDLAECPTLNPAYGDQAAPDTNDLNQEVYSCILDNNLGNDALIALLEFDNQRPFATGEWETKHDGIKALRHPRQKQ